MIYIAVDPGKETGIAKYTDKGLWTTSSIEWRAVPAYLKSYGHVTGTEGVFILEEYRNAGQSSKTVGESWSTKLNGALEALAYDLDWDVAYQTASDAKVACSDKQLREAGLWVGKNAHERDAVRHLLRHLSSVLEPEPRLWARRALAGSLVDL
jgi:hypothetical protein